MKFFSLFRLYLWPLLTISLFLCGYFLSYQGVISLPRIINHFQWNVLIIAVAMTVFTTLIAGTGFMNQLAVKLANWSQGMPLKVIALYAIVLFVLSSFLNNLTATLVVLPSLFVLLRSIKLNQKFITGIFSLLLAIGNCAGASTPIGDFPAIVIMGSGITTFTQYFMLAMPLFLTTAIVLIAMHLWLAAYMLPKQDQKELLQRTLGTTFLAAQYRHQKVNKKNLLVVVAVFVCMFLAWAIVPAAIVPPEMIALTGVCVAVSFTFNNGAQTKINQFDLKPFLLIGSFLLVAGVINDTGLLTDIANMLVENITDPNQLLLTVMVMTALLTGVISAGPSAAAMMPVIQSLAQGPFADQADWLAIAFAASVCAGSSLFYWSATAGFMLADQVAKADLKDGYTPLSWGLKYYLKYGLMHFVIQLTIGIAWVFIGMRFWS